MKRTWLRIGFGGMLVLWMVIIFLFSNQPAVQSSKISGGVSTHLVEKIDHILGLNLSKEEMNQIAEYIDYPVRKAAHMMEYAILALLSYGFLCQMVKTGKIYWMAWLFSTFYAATDEFHQLFVEGRAGRISDVCVDAAGAAIGLLICYILQKIVGKHCEKKAYLIK